MVNEFETFNESMHHVKNCAKTSLISQIKFRIEFNLE